MRGHPDPGGRGIRQLLLGLRQILLFWRITVLRPGEPPITGEIDLDHRGLRPFRRIMKLRIHGRSSPGMVRVHPDQFWQIGPRICQGENRESHNDNVLLVV